MDKSGSEGRGEQTTARKRGTGGSPLTLLLEAQSPDDERERPPERHLMPAPGPATASRVRPPQPSGRGALPNEGNQGDEWDAYVTLDTYDRDERGINPQGREAGGDGVLVVVVGATTHQGGRESRPQGEGAQAMGRSMAGRYA